MDRRTLIAALATGSAIVLLALAASAGPGRIWVAPSSGETPSVDGGSTPDNVVPQATVAGRSEWPAWVGTTLQIVAGVLLAMLVVTALLVAGRVGGRVPLRWRSRRIRADQQVTPLPEVPERELMLDVAAARAALLEGSPRNAIVACWMQLERDAAAAGLARMVAETPAEYVQRVVMASSVDRAPIEELAALYREARFSRHTLGDDQRARAVNTLHRVAASLTSNATVSA